MDFCFVAFNDFVYFLSFSLFTFEFYTSICVCVKFYATPGLLGVCDQ